MIELLKILILQVTITILPINWILPYWYWECNIQYAGLYNPNDKTIYICKWKYQKEVIIHELWHHFYRYWLTEKDRENYKDLYKYDLNNSWSFINNASKKDILEDFAYNFTAVYFKNKSNDRVRFIKDLIKNIWVKDSN